MSEEQILRTWLMFAGVSGILLFLCALSNRVVVYRDIKDLSYSITTIVLPIIIFAIGAFISGENMEVSTFFFNILTGQVILGIGCLIYIYALIKIFAVSIACNGLILGLIIGVAKIVFSLVITVLSIGLINYLFREQRLRGHVFIFLLFTAIFGFFINVLINGDRVAARRELSWTAIKERINYE